MRIASARSALRIFALLPLAVILTHGACGADPSAAAMTQGIEVYLYCIDDAVAGVAESELQSLRHRGLRLFACAYAAQRRGLSFTDREVAVFAGLGSLHDIQSHTDRFVAFN